MKKRLGVGADTIGTLDEETALQVVDDGGGAGGNNLDEAAEDASIIRFVNQVLKDAIELRASDIHLEPFEDELRIRYRIDGVLQEVPVPPQIKRFQPAIVARVKILSHLNIAEKRLPQDGRIKVRIDDAEVDIRVSVIPMLHGEAVVMRLLRQNSSLRGAWANSAWAARGRLLGRVLQLPHGIVLVTGPTGSGKTSTLYTALNEINDAERKIITIEDPGRIPAQGRQPDSGFRKVRAHVRARPALHPAPRSRTWCSSAKSATRKPRRSRCRRRSPVTWCSRRCTPTTPPGASRGWSTWASSPTWSLPRSKPCSRSASCACCAALQGADHSPTADAYKAQVGIPANAVIYRSVGCRECRNTGFFGRRAIFEWMDSSNEIRQLVLKNASSDQIRDAARRAGMKTLADDGWRLVQEGVTTIEEVLSVTTVHEEDRAPRQLAMPPPRSDRAWPPSAVS
jgi:type II secretory ATPase GspE/PulE/Tfp pilus assembly ATPase PilB-like protein